MLAAVFVEDVLDHLLAPLVLEIDVDVGRLAALRRDEALEEEVGALGAHVGDPEAIADGGVRRRAASLAENFLRAGELHDVADGEEIGLVSELLDDLQLVLDRCDDLRRHAFRIAPGGAFPGEPHQLVEGRRALAGGFERIVVLQLVEREGEALKHAKRLGDRLRIFGEEARHLRGALHVPLGIRFEQPAGGVERPLLAHAGEHVLQPAALGRVIEHVAEREERNLMARGKRGERREPSAVVAVIEARRAEPDMAGEGFGEGGEGVLQCALRCRAVT